MYLEKGVSENKEQNINVIFFYYIYLTYILIIILECG
jgi:hypothetical protein